jgi:hypothetical protein
MRLIKVVFIDEALISVSVEYLISSYRGAKQYAFFIDVITNDAYTNPMIVVDILSNTPETARELCELKKKGINVKYMSLKYIKLIPTTRRELFEGTNQIIKEENNMEEKRNIKVTLEQAIEWYNSGNSTLRTLALSAYTEDELKFNLKYINSKVCNTCFCASVPANEAEKYNTLADLAIIAKFFNGSWKKTTNNTGYFLGNFNNGCGPIIDTCSGVGVYQHNTVQYAGVVYFKNQEDAIKAVKILGKRVKSLFD